jgi:hypothetical protein
MADAIDHADLRLRRTRGPEAADRPGTSANARGPAPEGRLNDTMAMRRFGDGDAEAR